MEVAHRVLLDMHKENDKFPMWSIGRHQYVLFSDVYTELSVVQVGEGVAKVVKGKQQERQVQRRRQSESI